MDMFAAQNVGSDAQDSIWTSFASFSMFHLATVATCAALMVASCRMGLLWRGTDRERRFRLAWGWTIVLVKTIDTAYWFWPGIYSFEESLPLQLCDLACIVAAIAMLTQWRLSRTLLYFWGIGLSTQALATPTLKEGLGDPHYWLFWLTHLMIVGSAVYDLVVLGYRPHLADVAKAAAVTLTWVGVVTFLNVTTGTNYGYIGNVVPSKPTIINKLGPWPGRLFIVIGIVAVLFAVMWLVWPLAYALLHRPYPRDSRDEAAPGPGGTSNPDHAL
jgi:hypothetical integral membrane protein (TIGR02206 family)